MAYAITPYVVRLDRLKKIFGSGDEKLFEEILEQQSSLLSDIDMINDACGFCCSDALRALVFSDKSEEMPAYLYGYAFEVLCAHIGDELPPIHDISGAYEWIGEIDSALGLNRVKLKLGDLVYSGCPISLPDQDDFPCIGFWCPADIREAFKALQAVDMAAMNCEVSETISCIKAWLAVANRDLEASIIGFMA